MSERKVLNKYYPPDFDPAKIPKLKRPKGRQYVVRLMAPFNMRCKCGEYIYKGRKFNARKETVQNERYMGLPIFRFYIKCPRCLFEITFKTDPKNSDYAMEHGATRNFHVDELEERKRIQQEREDEERNNPTKVLENRTKDTKREMEVLENLQELKEKNQRQAQVDHDEMIAKYREMERRQKEREDEEDERELREILELQRQYRLRKSEESSRSSTQLQNSSTNKPADIVTLGNPPKAQGSSATGVKQAKTENWIKNYWKLGYKVPPNTLVVDKRKKPAKTAEPLPPKDPSKSIAPKVLSLVPYSDSDSDSDNQLIHLQKDVLELQQHKRKRDPYSDDEEESSRSRTQLKNSSTDKPADIVTLGNPPKAQGSSATGVKRAKTENWVKNDWTLGYKVPPNTLVVDKRNKPAKTAEPLPPKDPSKSIAPKVLSLVPYSDSDSDSDNQLIHLQKDVLELQQHKRKRDPYSDDEEESSRSRTQLQSSSTDKPADIVTLGNPPKAQGSSATGVKRAKTENWVKNDWTLGYEVPPNTLVVDKRNKPAKTAEPLPPKDPSKSIAPKVLSLVPYSDSDSDSDNQLIHLQKDVLELQQHKRKRDPYSDDEEESSRSSTQLQNSSTNKPTDIVTLGNPPKAQGSSATGVKRAKTENWVKNDWTLGYEVPPNTLVVDKRNKPAKTAEPLPPKDPSKSIAPKVLSLVPYSDSDSDSDNQLIHLQKDVLELQQHKRKRDPYSDDEEESSRSSTQLQNSSTNKPTDIVTLGNPPKAQGSSATGVKRAKTENWVKNDWTLGYEVPPNTLVVDKRNKPAKTAEPLPPKDPSKSIAPKVLSLVPYSDSDSDSDNQLIHLQKDVLELQQHKRKRDPYSDDEEESSRSSTQLQNSSTNKPTDIVTLGNPPKAQGSSATGVKRAKTENWVKNDWTLGYEVPPNTLVVDKRNKPAKTAEPLPPKDPSKSIAPKVLSLVPYSDSDSDSDNQLIHLQKDVLELQQHKRKRDPYSDDEEESSRSSTQLQNSSTNKPTDIVTLGNPPKAQGSSATGVKRAMTENWIKNYWKLGYKVPPNTLVVDKCNKPAKTAEPLPPKDPSKSIAPKVLSLVPYSDSDSDSDSQGNFK
uniref:Splicing factor YJU2 n=1 Tax=Gouania willdenowi TaxID=441366 RepID=A0A8C5G689_GOUWI